MEGGKLVVVELDDVDGMEGSRRVMDLGGFERGIFSLPLM